MLPKAVREANRKSDYFIFWMNIVFCVLIILVTLTTGYDIAAETNQYEFNEYSQITSTESFFEQNIGFLMIGVVVLIVTMVFMRMMRQQYLGNALQVEYSAYDWLRLWADEVAKDLEMPKVEIMVTQDPAMNAFAFGFMKPYTIVLHSGLVRYATKDELKAIVVHEMAHIKYGHTVMSTYSSVFRVIPVLGAIFGWMLDFWSRRAELTADRLALTYLRNKNQVKRALICVHVGPDVAQSFNELAQQWQVYQTDSAFNRFTQSFSSHPFLVRRLQQIDNLAPSLIGEESSDETSKVDEESSGEE